MENMFKITSCKYTGCCNYKKGTCWFNGKDILKWKDSFQFFSTGEQCKLRQQINRIKTREFLES